MSKEKRKGQKLALETAKKKFLKVLIRATSVNT